ncbi:MAG: GNAT family N-acetyltransferase [Ktedonobacteraceae bacterium]
MSISLRQMTPTDIAIVDSILMAAYASPGSFQEELTHYLALQPDGWFIALLDGRPVGAGGVVNYGPFSYLGLIAILPDQQKRGIGRSLTEHLLTWLSRQQCPIALLEASPAGAPLYTKLGFQVDDTTLAFQLTGPVPHAPCSTPTEHHQSHPERSEGSRVPHALYSIAIEHLQSTDLAELIALDAPRFGANRSNVFSIYLASYPERCFVSRNPQGHITGCIVGQADALGPWIAQSHEEAEALLAHALTLAFQHPPRIRVPTSNHQALALVQAYGFREIRAFKHMRRGGIQHPQQREHIYALATAAIG